MTDKQGLFFRLDDVTFEYKAMNGKTKAISGLSMDVRAGEFIAIGGRNGSGKSTLARLLNALLYPKEGAVWICGTRSDDEAHLWDIRKEVGMIFQNPDNQIVATIVEDDVAFGPENLGVPTEELQKRVEEALKLTEMLAYRAHSPHMLSGGQKQRVSIAGILAMKPSCIVLDEASAMLDPSGRRELMGIIHRLNENDGITVIHITHHMDECIQADRLLVMDAGKIVLQGRPMEVFENEEQIVAAGLAVPSMVKLAQGLIRAGFNVNTNDISPEGLCEVLRRQRDSVRANNKANKVEKTEGGGVAD